MAKVLLSTLVLCLSAEAVWAHASEQGFVLLLPTDVYIAAGGATVVLTVALLAVLPGGVAGAIFRPVPLAASRPNLHHLFGLVAAGVLLWLIWRGLTGSRDPMMNPLSLSVWVVFWIALVSLQGLIGDLWRWINPWSGPAAFLGRIIGRRARWRYPRVLGHWPGVASFLGFAGFLLADPAPTDPGRLAVAVAVYWAFNMAGVLLFGGAWLLRVEGITLLMRSYARMGLLGRAQGRLALGVPGWQVLAQPVPSLGLAVLMLVLLGSGSFDGLNETFLWLGWLGLNPLEFPGRSAVIGSNLLGLLLTNLGLIAVFALCLWLGARLAKDQAGPGLLIRRYAPTLLPIALAYHIGHYLTSFLLDGQYVLAWLSEALGAGHVHVTAGFLNSPGPVRLIWMTQAGVVVAGHVIAQLLAHAIAVRAGQSTRRAALAQAPLALFMVGYTVFGLWLLATPRGA
ncbi:hypothetical protein RA2_03360 [Roseovarius sp. A-2]|uniref:hypothetical protein n=1 Tax=Roseovarius sp. A-2 TaxID=1570360 RepID=UPI0009B56095|nr:hypothetical protein [Roseovarius sp. A-2]GAW36290.1 hypothetical protein RA2_03360 [Roseovarius sp. A-2]